MHLDPRALGQEQRLVILIDRLPGEIPVGNSDQPRAASIGQGRPDLHQLREIVGVRIDGQHIGVHGKHQRVGDWEIANSSRDVQGLVVFQLDYQRKASRRIGGKVQANGRPYLLGFSIGMEVRVENEFTARVDAPGKAGRFFDRRPAGFPKEEVTIQIEDAAEDGQVHSGESFFGRQALAID